MDITKLTIEQLKALAYDEINLLEQTRNNIKLINTELTNRQKDVQAKPAKKKSGE